MPILVNVDDECRQSPLAVAAGFAHLSPLAFQHKKANWPSESSARASPLLLRRPDLIADLHSRMNAYVLTLYVCSLLARLLLVLRCPAPTWSCEYDCIVHCNKYCIAYCAIDGSAAKHFLFWFGAPVLIACKGCVWVCCSPCRK